jgi:purine nucleosidase
MSNARIPVLFDTDIGSDIDDAVALAYLLTQPRCELLGVTTVTGEPLVRAQLADAMCQAFGRKEVPVYAGAGTPLLVAQQQKEAPQKSVLGKWPHRDKFAPNMAIDFLRQTIRSRPGEITLLSVGPLTNIGLLFALDPELPRLLKQYVMMGGVYRTWLEHYGLAEWNAKGDPHATAITFAANAPQTRCIGLDVTTQCRLPAEECRRRFSKGPLKIVGEMAEVWFRNTQQITFHDPLAAAVVFEPSLCEYQSGHVEVQLDSQRLRGMTLFNAHTEMKPHQVAVNVKPEAFFEHYFRIVERG